MLASTFIDTSAPRSPALRHTASKATPMAAPDAGALATHITCGTIRVLGAKEHLFRVGDRASQVYLVEAGHICTYRMMSDGRRQVIDFAYPGDIIGLGALGEYAVNAQASVKSRVRCIALTALHAVARQDHRLGLQLYEAVSKELLAAREMLFTVSQCTAAERLAGFLLALSRRSAHRGEDRPQIVLPMTRIDIADFLGLTIETVSRTFTKFKNDGLIDIEQCILVTLKDCAELARVAAGKDAAVG